MKNDTSKKVVPLPEFKSDQLFGTYIQFGDGSRTASCFQRFEHGEFAIKQALSKKKIIPFEAAWLREQLEKRFNTSASKVELVMP